MIICEERAMERILSLGFCDTAIPISIRQNIGEEAEITVLPSLKRVARKFEKLFVDNYFSDEAHRWLRGNVAKFMDSIGYRDNRQSRKISIILSHQKNSASKLPETDAVILERDTENLTSADIGELLKFDHIVAAVLKDGKVISCAYTDLDPTDCSAVELGIETAAAYRKQGHAKSALSKLVSTLEEDDITPIFICSSSNKASLKTALSCGFEKEGYEYNYVFRRK